MKSSQPAPPEPSFQLGGQALIEGVMMRSPHYVGAAVRHPDGSIETRVEEFHSLFKRRRYLNIPFVRGSIALFEMMGLGMRYLNWSSNIALQTPKQNVTPPPVDENAAVATEATASVAIAAASPLAPVAVGVPISSPAPANGSTPGAAPAPAAQDKSLPWWMFLLTAAASFSIGIALFVALPNILADHFLEPVTNSQVLLNLFEGAIKLSIFIAYVWIIGRRPDIRRVFEYHGAEHKVVYAAENNRPITPEGARPFDTPHPRCGTGFALLVIVVSVICHTALPWTESHLTRVLMRIALLPVVAGVSYEILKLTTYPRWRGLAQIIMTPGMWLQRLTTRQPDDAQLEVSCAAMQVVLDAEAGKKENEKG